MTGGHDKKVAWIHGVLFAAAMTAAVLTTSASDWQPIGVLFVLLALNVASDALALNVRGLHLSGSFAAIVLAMALLGPAPAIVVALGPILVSAVRERPATGHVLSNLATFAVFPLVGGLWVRAADLDAQPAWIAAGLLLGIYLATNFLNFCLIYNYRVLTGGWRWLEGLKTMYAPVIPAQLGIGLLTIAIVVIERYTGPEAIVVTAPIVIIIQWLLRTALAAFDRGVQLEERNRELASLQFGLINSLLKTLSLRDHMTARHSAAVARYAREVAAELGLEEEEQERIHTAALFHDIGKFIFPDSILLSDRRLSQDELRIVRRHPAVGAELIREIEGYGPVADIVLHHHERVDGEGYPHGLSGDAIPLGSRIIAVADVYDVITSRDTYRAPVSMPEAFAELRRSAGSQLDPEVVEAFIGVMTRRGIVFRHSVSADFEAELAIERRVRDYASPKPKAAA